MITKIAQRRAHILTVWEKHGLAATRDAYSVSQATLYRWKRSVDKAGGKDNRIEPEEKNTEVYQNTRGALAYHRIPYHHTQRTSEDRERKDSTSSENTVSPVGYQSTLSVNHR